MRIIIGLIAFIVCWALFAIGYRVTPPPDPAPITETCPPPGTPHPTTVGPAPAGGGTASAGHPVRGWPCPAVTSTMTVTEVPPTH